MPIFQGDIMSIVICGECKSCGRDSPLLGEKIPYCSNKCWGRAQHAPKFKYWMEVIWFVVSAVVIWYAAKHM